jgi:hypothetical protein
MKLQQLFIGFFLFLPTALHAQTDSIIDYYEQPEGDFHCEVQLLEKSPETGAIAGVVRSEAVDISEMKGACVSVLLRGEILAATTMDSKGEYKVKFLPEGTYDLHFQWKELTETAYEIVVRPGKISFVDFLVVPKKSSLPNTPKK